MATLTTRPRHSSTFWILTSCAVFVALLVIGVAVLLAVHPATKDAIFIFWTMVTGTAVGPRPQ